MRVDGMAHTPAVRSISAHSAPRTSPERAAVNTRNSNASFTAGIACDARTALSADATSVCGTARKCCTTVRCDPSTAADALAGVVGPILHHHGPLHYRPDTLAHTTRGLGPDVPDGREDRKQVGAGHVGDRHPADAGKHVPLHARLPFAGVLRIAPSRPLVVPHALGGVRERGHPGAALGGQRVAAGAGELAVGEGRRTNGRPTARGKSRGCNEIRGRPYTPTSGGGMGAITPDRSPQVLCYQLLSVKDGGPDGVEPVTS